MMGPLNEHLKKSGNCQPMTKEMADWYVAHFGGNFVEMKDFVDEVLQKKEISREQFLNKGMKKYDARFDKIWGNPKMRVIVDDLLKHGSFESQIPYDDDALQSLIQANIVAVRADDFTWHKRLVRVAYEKFVEKQKKRWYQIF